MIPNDAPEYREGAPLPGFRPVSDAILSALPALLPHGRETVSEVATRRKVNAGGHWTAWDNSVAPYMTEPMDATMSRRFESAVFVGPARSAKTEGMIINPLVHSILVAPRKVAVFYMSQAAAKEWSNTELGPILRATPNLAQRLRLDNVHEKTFQGGGRLTVDWPVDSKLSGRTIDLVLMADYDTDSYQDVKGIGPAFAAGRKRHTSAGTRGMNVAESSPRFPILDESWSPSTPHEAPPCEGILGYYNTGTRGRLYWTCPSCKGEFQPTFDRLSYPDEGTPTERGAAAYMSCLHCGSVIEPHQKAELNATGRWLHEGREIDGVVELVTLAEVEKLRPTAVVSWWLHGPAAALASWSQIVSRYLEAVEEFERTGDEKPLKAATNLDLGLPYRPRAMSDAARISESALRDQATDHEWQTCPAETRFLLAAVDVQAGRFVVQIMAHLADGERVLVDRFDIHNPPDTAPRSGDRQIDPAKFGEDWDALFDLADLSYPVANAEHRMRLLSIVCDAGGAPGVTPNAYAFYRKARKSHPRRFHLVRGFGGENAKRAEVKAPETAHQGKRHVAKDVLLVRAGTDRLKDEIAASLIRSEAGTRAIHIPRGAPSDIFEEFASERRGAKGWEKRPGVKRNEALDLAVYDLALAIVLGAEKIDWSRCPAWAVIGPSNSFAVHDLEDGHALEGEVRTKRPAKRRKAKRGRRSFDGWG
jgi:phage terminase large subunit GpA-like protein